MNGGPGGEGRKLALVAIAFLAIVASVWVMLALRTSSPAPDPATAPPVASAVVVPSATTRPARPRAPPPDVHPVVASMPPEAESSISAVARYIADRERDPRSRVKALHDWLIRRVAYDAAGYRSGGREADPPPAVVFRTRKAVCDGYANLLEALGKITGDEIAHVPGLVRQGPGRLDVALHAWNAARIDGVWHLIDVTWDGGHVGSEAGSRYSTDYLFMPPERFITSHWPLAEKWQLLERPVSQDEFSSRPLLSPALFAHGLELLYPARSQVSVARTLDLAVGNPQGAALLAQWTPRGGDAGQGCPAERGQLRCDFPAAGTYDVRLWVRSDELEPWEHAASVEASAAP